MHPPDADLSSLPALEAGDQTYADGVSLPLSFEQAVAELHRWIALMDAAELSSSQANRNARHWFCAH